jgi:hypothetical protein
MDGDGELQAKEEEEEEEGSKNHRQKWRAGRDSRQKARS